MLEDLKVGGNAPFAGPKRHYAFVTIYREFYAHSRMPIIKATVSLETVQPGRAGIGHYADKSVEAWLHQVLSVLPMARENTPGGRALNAKFQTVFDDIGQQDRRQATRLAEKTKPSCTSVTFTGVAAVHEEDLVFLNRSKDRSELLSAHPLVCETVSGGRSLNGAILEPWSRAKCKGLSLFKGQRAQVQHWTQDMLRIATDVNFDTGRIPVALWINRSDAKCQ